MYHLLRPLVASAALLPLSAVHAAAIPSKSAQGPSGDGQRAARAATRQLAPGEVPKGLGSSEWSGIWRAGLEAVHAGLVRALLVLIALVSVALSVHAQPMTVDPSFVAAVSGGQGRVLTTVVQPDGKVLIGGNFRSVDGVARSGIARLLPNGRLDTSFVGVGIDSEGVVYSVALQSDGKVLVAGGFDTMHGQPRQNVVRLNTDGSLDASFGSLNFFTDAFAPWFVSDVTVQSDGRILIAGQFYEVGDSAHPAGLARRSVARLSSNGSIDTTFNSPWSADDIHVNRIALQPDGKILLTGYWASMPDGGDLSRLVRINRDGTLDRTFLARVDRTNFQNSVIVQPDGKIVMAGNFDSANGQPRGKVVRFNADGSLDLSFNAGTGPDAWGSSTIALQPDGKLIVGGVFDNFNGVARKNLVRLNVDGSVDTGFVVATDQSGSVNALATVPSGGFVAGGKFTMVGGVSTVSVARVLPVQRTVTTSGERATISPSGPQRVPVGGSVSFTITPDPGYHINDAFGCPGRLNGNVYTVGPVTADCTLWVKAISDSLNARCGPAANEPTHTTPTQRLCSTGDPTTPSLVTDPFFGGAGRVWRWVCRPLLGASTQCTAPYLPYLVTPSAGPGGRMSPGSPQGAADGYDVTFTVTPNSGYEIDTVTGCNGTLWGDRYTTQNVRADCTVRATFKALPPAVTGTCGSANGQAAIAAPTANLCSAGSPGTVSGSGPWTWVCTGAGGGTTAACSAPVRTFNVTPSVGAAGGGTIAPAAVQTALNGQTLSFTLTPAASYAIASVGGTCGGGLVGNTYTTNAIGADCTVIANFALTVDGACGSANGVAVTSAPAANLCSAGNSTAVTGTSTGPWAWSCNGAGGGSNASCSAPAFTPVTHFEGPSPTGTGTVKVDLGGGGPFCGFTGTPAMIAAAPGASPARPAGIVFPHGLFDFKASNCTPGSTITLTMQLPSALPTTAKYYKWGPEPGNATPHWYEMPATIAGTTVTFSITDGAQGDDDLDNTNGTIVDQGGPGVPGEPVAGAAVTAVPTLGEWSLMLLGLLAAGMGAQRLRARPQP